MKAKQFEMMNNQMKSYSSLFIKREDILFCWSKIFRVIRMFLLKLNSLGSQFEINK